MNLTFINVTLVRRRKQNYRNAVRTTTAPFHARVPDSAYGGGQVSLYRPVSRVSGLIHTNCGAGTMGACELSAPARECRSSSLLREAIQFNTAPSAICRSEAAPNVNSVAQRF